MKKGIILVLSGPSGVGKGTISGAIRSNHSNIELSVSATTRAPRTGEIDGVHYYFIDQSKFDALVENNEFVEYVRKYNSSYGTLKSELNRIMNGGHNVLLDIEPIGAMNIKKMYPEAVMIFVIPRSFDALKDRLWKRGSETPETFDRRNADFIKELNTADQYDYIVLNDALEDAVNAVERIVEAESEGVRCEDYVASRHLEKIEKLKKGEEIC